MGRPWRPLPVAAILLVCSHQQQKIANSQVQTKLQIPQRLNKKKVTYYGEVHDLEDPDS